MRNGNLENITVEQVVQKLPEARSFLREARIDRTSMLTLREAAAAVSMESDELLAQIEDRLRRSARRAPARVEEAEGEPALA
ncbi:MAG: hypothetical protein SNJ69_12090 [Chloroflexaceae bacterium]